MSQVFAESIDEEWEHQSSLLAHGDGGGEGVLAVAAAAAACTRSRCAEEQRQLGGLMSRRSPVRVRPAQLHRRPTCHLRTPLVQALYR